MEHTDGRGGPVLETTVERGADQATCVVRLRGEIDISTVPGLRYSVESAVMSGCTNVVLDLSSVTYADSSALGLIVWLDRLLDPRKGKLVLAGANRDVGRVLELSGLVGLAPTITAAADVTDAVGGLDTPDRDAEPVRIESLSLSADVEALPRIRERVCGLLEDTRMSEATIFDVRVAVGEALANAIRHGSPGGVADTVGVTVKTFTDRVVIEVVDSGSGFDGRPDATDDVYAASGRGVMFMKALMDRVEFSPVPGGGTSVSLEKHLDDTPRPS